MFVHFGLYSVLQHGEWAMHQEQIPVSEYEKLAAKWKNIKRHAARDWALLAREAGMKYMVFTTKHHEGYCLWDTKMTDFNSVKSGPGRDLVGEYVAAARSEGLKVGLYYSLMDWHHPDGMIAAQNAESRRRFLDFTQGCVRELCTQYGKIDILWYDIPHPFKNAEGWESVKMNALVRELQPGILINNRSRLPEDFGTPEGEVTAMEEGRMWEACMTFNDDWGYSDRPAGDWRSLRDVIRMLRVASAGQGNLLLNMGPKYDGAIPREAGRTLKRLGKWISSMPEVVYGNFDRADKHFEKYNNLGYWTLKGTTAYYWLCRAWPGERFSIGGIKTKLRSAQLLPSRMEVRFKQESDRIVFSGLPPVNPEKMAGCPVLKLEFEGEPRQILHQADILS